MSVLVVAEHNNQELSAVTLNVCAAAKQINDDVHLLVAGFAAQPVIEQAAKVGGVSKVLASQAEHFQHQLAEELAPLVAQLAPNYSHVLAPASTFGKNLLPRAAALVDAQPLSDIIAVESDDTFKRPIYAGNVIATVKSLDAIKFLTVRATAFDAAPVGDAAAVEAVNATTAIGSASLLRSEISESDRPDLTSAKVVISGGRGMLSEENFDLLYTLADKLDAAVGASRAAVDAGFVPNDHQVGQTGKVVAPDLYIAIGISGAIQHLAGMKGSKVIVAINKDEEAPIFQVADYGLVADLFDVLPELTAKVS